MFRANILILAGIALIYLLLLKSNTLRDIIVKTIIICVILAIFIIPWTIRNYRHFDAFTLSLMALTTPYLTVHTKIMSIQLRMHLTGQLQIPDIMSNMDTITMKTEP